MVDGGWGMDGVMWKGGRGDAGGVDGVMYKGGRGDVGWVEGWIKEPNGENWRTSFSNPWF